MWDLGAGQVAHREARSAEPIAPVAADIVVHQDTLEVVGALPPVNAAVEDEVAGYVLPASV